MTQEEILTKIAQEELDVETLERRWSDNFSVWGIKRALESAYEAGRQAK